jgi:lipid II:glycine glycyltransferase (peptidoglycan interpeptide bridge formation enzyme)
MPAWDDLLSRHPNAHLLQTPQWAQLKSQFGWRAETVIHGQAGALLLFRPLPLGFTLAYLPRGPVGTGLAELLPRLDALCRRNRAIALKVEPDQWQETGGLHGDAAPPGFIPSPQPIQPPRTLVVDLRPDEETLLARMKQKTRYNLRLALRKGVIVRASGDLDTFNRLMQATGAREAFGVHSPAYYRRAYELFQPRGMCELLIAEFEGTPLAALMVFARGGRAWYFYGASANEHREAMAPYLLQWEAMRWARARGCTEYDLWGVPDEDEAALEAGFAAREDGLWGVYRFKRGFGGTLRRAAGPWDRVYNPAMYKLYDWWVSRS